MTWPQIHLLLDGANYNAPDFDDGSGKSDAPPKPDEKTEPIEALRWALKHSPAIPAFLRKSDQEVEELCQRFQADIDAGLKVWDEFDHKWVDADG